MSGRTPERFPRAIHLRHARPAGRSQSRRHEVGPRMGGQSPGSVRMRLDGVQFACTWRCSSYSNALSFLRPAGQALEAMAVLAGFRFGEVAVTRISPAFAVDCTIARHIPWKALPILPLKSAARSAILPLSTPISL